MRGMIVDGFTINDASDCYIIAEIGHNHQGDVNKCKEMIREAKLAGASAVKLQKRDNKTLYTKAAYDKPYENENSFGLTYGEHREFLEFNKEQYAELINYSREVGITFFATAFDIASADFLEDLDIPAYKIASGDLRNIPLIQHVAKFNKPMIISTGASTMEDVQRVYDAVRPINKQICFLQCTAGYPAAFEELNLRVIETYRKAFPDVVVGLSSHDNGIAMAVAAYVLGARVIEKHFTLNRSLKGTDHSFSLEPVGLRKMARDLKRLRGALGDGFKRVFDSEKSAAHKMGKSIVAVRNLPAGTIISMDSLALKSPGGGLAPYEIEKVLGKKLIRALDEDSPVSLEILSD